MKKLISYAARTFVATSFILFVACNGAQTHDDTNRTESDNGSSHPDGSDTTMTDTTRNATSGIGTNKQVGYSDTGFITKGIMDNMMDLQLSKMGRDKGSNKQVSTIARQLINDHSQLLAELKTLATKKQLKAPTTTTMDMTAMQTLGSANGQDFDKAWVAEMLKMHEAKLGELQMAIDQATDGEVKEIATKTLPKIQMHRDMLAKADVD